jgi:hypothetical protein
MTKHLKIQVAALVATVNGILALTYPAIASAQTCGGFTFDAGTCNFNWESFCQSSAPPGCCLAIASCQCINGFPCGPTCFYVAC